jgi:hypothetical protein
MSLGQPHVRRCACRGLVFRTARREGRYCSRGCDAQAVRARTEPPCGRPPSPAEIRARASVVRAGWTAARGGLAGWPASRCRPVCVGAAAVGRMSAWHTIAHADAPIGAPGKRLFSRPWRRTGLSRQPANGRASAGAPSIMPNSRTLTSPRPGTRPWKSSPTRWRRWPSVGHGASQTSYSCCSWRPTARTSTGASRTCRRHRPPMSTSTFMSWLRA